MENTVKRLGRISTNRALLVLCALGFLWASSGLVTAQDRTKGQGSGPAPTRGIPLPYFEVDLNAPKPGGKRQQGVAVGDFNGDGLRKPKTGGTQNGNGAPQSKTHNYRGTVTLVR